MKKNLLAFLTAILFATFSFAATPDVVLKSFAAKYPTATGAVWTGVQANYNVDFKMGGQVMKGLFASTGTWMNTEFSVAASSLPAAVVASGQKVLNGGVIIGSFKVDDAIQGQYFRVVLKAANGVEKTGKIKASGEILV